GDATAVVGDVTDAAFVADLAGGAGAGDVLVHHVGHSLTRDNDFFTAGPDEWDALHAVNLGHVLLCTRAFVDGMIERGRGGIVNVSSVEALPAGPSRRGRSA